MKVSMMVFGGVDNREVQITR